MDGAFSYQLEERWLQAREGASTPTPWACNWTSVRRLNSRGEPGQWTPELFLLAAVTACFIVTFRAIAEASCFEFLALDVETRGTIAKNDSGWQFTKIVLKPRATVIESQHREIARRLLEKTERACLITRSLACNVSIVPMVKLAEEVLAQ